MGGVAVAPAQGPFVCDACGKGGLLPATPLRRCVLSRSTYYCSDECRHDNASATRHASRLALRMVFLTSGGSSSSSNDGASGLLRALSFTNGKDFERSGK